MNIENQYYLLLGKKETMLRKEIIKNLSIPKIWQFLNQHKSSKLSGSASYLYRLKKVLTYCAIHLLHTCSPMALT